MGGPKGHTSIKAFRNGWWQRHQHDTEFQAGCRPRMMIRVVTIESGSWTSIGMIRPQNGRSQVPGLNYQKPGGHNYCKVAKGDKADKEAWHAGNVRSDLLSMATIKAKRQVANKDVMTSTTSANRKWQEWRSGRLKVIAAIPDYDPLLSAHS